MQSSGGVVRQVLTAGVVMMLAAGGLALVGASPRTPVPTAFTYQGQVRIAGSPINGTADVRFSLFDAPTSPATQIGSTLTFNNLTLANGLLSLALDFGPGAFDGNGRWLEIEARSPAGSGSFTTLSPRQPITPVPYALYALAGPGASGALGQSATSSFGSAALGVTSSMTTYTLIPGLSQTITVPDDCSIHISSDGGVQTTVTSNPSGVSRVDVALFIDGQIAPDAGFRRITAANTGGVSSNNIANWHMTLATQLPPGQHTVEVRTRFDGGQTAIVSGDTNSPLQGQLTVMILKQ